MHVALPSELALERIQMTRAVLNAIAVAFRKEGASLPQSLHDDLRSANLPE